MKDKITFFRDQYNAPTGKVETGHYRALGSWMTTDIQNDPAEVLEALDLVEQARAGRVELEEWEGNAYAVEISPAGVVIEGLYTEDAPARYTLDEARAVLLQYWEFLVPALDGKTRAIEAWESENGHPHPCRPQL